MGLFSYHKHQEVSALNNIRRLRAYFQSHRKIGLAADLLTAVLLISLSILFYGCRQGAVNGFFMYVLVSNFIGFNPSFIDFSTSRKKQTKIKALRQKEGYTALFLFFQSYQCVLFRLNFSE